MTGEADQTLGQEIIKDLTELCETLEEGGRVQDKFTVRTVELNLQPQEYDAAAVRRTRQSLNASQAVFAAILGASAETVRSWEQGVRNVPRMACRLLDLINEHRDHWVKILDESRAEHSSA